MKTTEPLQVQCENRGSAFTIEENMRIGSGGQADVYGVPDNAPFAVKLYHKVSLDIIEKLRIMIQNPPGESFTGKGHASIAWPIDMIVSQAERKPVGFLMPRVNKMRPIIEFYNPKTRVGKCPGFSYLYLHRTARNLATAMHALHTKGYIVGDVNESNILVSDTALVTLVDVDSFEVRDRQKNIIHRCPVGRPDITAPELLAQLREGKKFDSVDRTPQQDLFGLAVLIFELLMEGTHPFAGIYTGDDDPPDTAQRILNGHFPFSTAAGIPYRPTQMAPPFTQLHPALQELFLQCFIAGHENPSHRPSAYDWQQALDKSSRGLIGCQKNPQHIYWEHEKQCPWCARTQKLGGRDPFPFIKGENVPTLGADGQLGFEKISLGKTALNKATSYTPKKTTQLVVAPPPAGEPLHLKLSKPQHRKIVRQTGGLDFLNKIPGEALMGIGFLGYGLCKLIHRRAGFIGALALALMGIFWFVSVKKRPWSKKWQPIVTAIIGLVIFILEMRALAHGL